MPYSKVTRDQFDVVKNRVTHRPTGASFSSYPGLDKKIASVNWSQCGDVLSTGEDYSRDEVGRMAEELMSEQEITE